MSPGIVRFYFDSKAAMLVASLQFLATEFEEQVLVPVSSLKARPVAALELLVDLYLDPLIASTRKVSVWYAFWGEASSRQEYYDICGQKDQRFAALVRELIEALIADSAQTHLDPDGIALGLIGVLEILWQDFAFQAEAQIDRDAAKGRCMAYLRSIFPGCFGKSPIDTGRLGVSRQQRGPAGWVYEHPRMPAIEIRCVFRSAWQYVGHGAQIARPGDFLAIEVAAERVMVVRDPAGALHALRNSCTAQPHPLVGAGVGHVGQFECKVHGLRFGLDGSGLQALELHHDHGLLFVRACASDRAPGALPGLAFAKEAALDLRPLGAPLQIAIMADWKVVVEQWLESLTSSTLECGIRHWSAARYLRLSGSSAQQAWRHQFIAPNQLLQSRPDGVAIYQVLPLAPGRSMLRRFDLTRCAQDRGARALRYLAGRLTAHARGGARALAESTHKGIVLFGYAAGGAVTVPAVAEFRRLLVARIPAMALERAPADL